MYHMKSDLAAKKGVNLCVRRAAVGLHIPIGLELGSHIEHLLLGHVSVLRG
jgi:hypothetical protein